jgi:hypothetical protein
MTTTIFVKVNKSVLEKMDHEKVRKVYREKMEWFPSGKRKMFLVWDETLNRVRWVKADLCTVVA